jgi:transcriptional regulator with GAF, ATPase, and Fis domain
MSKRNKLYLITDDLELVQNLKKIIGSSWLPLDLDFQFFSPYLWDELLDKPMFRKHLIERGVSLRSEGRSNLSNADLSYQILVRGIEDELEMNKLEMKKVEKNKVDVENPIQGQVIRFKNTQKGSSGEQSPIAPPSPQTQHYEPNLVTFPPPSPKSQFQSPRSFSDSSSLPSVPPVSHQRVLSMEEVEKIAIIKAIEAYRGNLSLAAKSLGLGRATLYRKIKYYGIDIEDIKNKTKNKSNNQNRVA